MTHPENVATPSAEDPRPFARIAVIGAGLVGGSVAAAAVAAGVPEVRLTDISAETRQRARARGLATAVVDDLGAAVDGAELVVVATPPASVADILERVARSAPREAILTDVASLKCELSLDVESRLRAMDADPGRFVGGHPMAGSERSGPDAADSSLFQGATWVLTPTPETSDATLRALSGFLRSLGARVLALSPQRHDELVALVSHLPQVAASVLADVAGAAVETAGDAVLAVAGGGFRDTTRIAASDAGLWLGILRGNRAAVLESLTAYRRRLDEVHAALLAGDWDQVEAVLRRGGAARRRFVPKSEDAPVVDLIVALEDRPGTVGVATTALGEAGVNVEDLAMRHAAEGRRGALVVRIEAAAVDRATAALRARGLQVHVEGEERGEAQGGDGR